MSFNDAHQMKLLGTNEDASLRQTDSIHIAIHQHAQNTVAQNWLKARAPARNVTENRMEVRWQAKQ